MSQSSRPVIVVALAAVLIAASGYGYFVFQASKNSSSWTQVSQRDVRGQKTEGGIALQGLSPQTETIVKLNGRNTLLLVQEYRIDQQDSFMKSLQTASIRSQHVADRDGFVVPVGGLVPASGFVMVGQHTVSILMLGDTRYGNYLNWPETLEPEVQNFITTLKTE